MKQVILTFIIALMPFTGFSQELFPCFGKPLTAEQKRELVTKVKADPLWSLIQANTTQYFKEVQFAFRFVKVHELKLPATWNSKKSFVTHLKDAGFVNAEQLEANMKFSQELMGMLNRKYPDLIKLQQKDWLTLF